MQASTSNRTYPGFFLHVCLLLLTIGFTSCTKDENAERDYPRLSTLEVTHIGQSGAMFSAEILSGNRAAITEYGFVWSTTEYPDVDQHDKQFKAGAPSGLTFTDTIRSALKLNETYHMRSYAKTDRYIIYGNIITFKSLGSLAPQITGFAPQSATWGDTIRITGKHFRYNKEALQVKLGSIVAQIVASTAQTIDIIVPLEKNSGKVHISVSSNGVAHTSTSEFTYLQPAVTSFSPLTASFEDTLTIHGTNFSLHKSAPQIYFNEAPARTVYASREMLKVVVPSSLTTKQATLTIAGPATSIASTTPFTLEGIELISIQPDSVFTDSEHITITGRNFSPLPDGNKVFINGLKASIIAFSNTSIKVNLPPDIIPNKLAPYQANVPVRVETGQLSATFTNGLVIYWRPRWKRLKDFPGARTSNGIGFAIDGKGYTNLTNTGDLWEYDPLSDRWTQKASFPGKPRKDPSAFVIGQTAYIGLGASQSATYQTIYHNDFYKYVPFANTWVRIADYPKAVRRAVSFVSNGTAYVGTGRFNDDTHDLTNEFFKYIPEENQWKASLPFIMRTESATGFSIDNSGYLFQGSKIYRYNPLGWETKSEISSSFNSDGITFTIGQSVYIYNPYMWEYNSVTNKISLLHRPPTYFHSLFVIGNKAYGVSTNNEVWLFDPKGIE